jgi:hypothetical protein
LPAPNGGANLAFGHDALKRVLEKSSLLLATGATAVLSYQECFGRMEGLRAQVRPEYGLGAFGSEAFNGLATKF